WTFLGIFQPLDNLGVKAFTIATILVLTTANYFGVGVGGAIASFSTVLKLLGIGLVVVLGFTFGDGSADHYRPLLEAPDAEYSTRLGLFGALFGAFLGAFWAYDGWNNIPSLGGEVRDAKRNIPLAVTIGTVSVMAVYLLVNAAYLY